MIIFIPQTSMSDNKDLNFAFALSRPCLRLLGVWPSPHTPLSNFRRPNLRFMIVVVTLNLYVIVPQLTNMIRAWGNITRMIQYVASANFSLMALCKLVVTWYHGKTLQTVMTSILKDWVTLKSDWERKTMLKVAKRGRILSIRCFAWTSCTVLFYLSFNFLKFYRNLYMSKKNLVYNFAYPYNVQKMPNYIITYLAQISGGLYTAVINVTVDSFIAILLLHVCAQLINLRRTLIKVVDGLANKSISSLTFKEGIAAIVIRHEHLIKNAETIDECYSGVLFVHMLCATFQLCFETFQVFTMITDHSEVTILKLAFVLFYAILMLLQLYFYSYSAEKLVTESTSMAYGVYECKWYDLPPKNAKDLMFIAYRSTIPLRLTAGKFGVFSMEMFGTIVRTSMGYVSALLTIKEN